MASALHVVAGTPKTHGGTLAARVSVIATRGRQVRPRCFRRVSANSRCVFRLGIGMAIPSAENREWPRNSLSDRVSATSSEMRLA
jgi:hypothetical protein